MIKIFSPNGLVHVYSIYIAWEDGINHLGKGNCPGCNYKATLINVYQRDLKNDS